MENFTDAIMQLMKDVAISFHTKCDKYHKEDLSPTLINILYEEALDETITIAQINHTGNVSE